MTDANRLLFSDGPLAGKTIGYWTAPPTLEGDWPGRYEIANVATTDECGEIKVGQEYRYNANFTR